jgi:RND superfamily putative drug exporter
MQRLARWCFSHRRYVLLAWLALAVGTTVLGSSVGTNYNANFTLNGSQAADAFSLLEKSAPKSSGSTSQIVVATKSGRVTDPQVRQRVSAALVRVSRLPHVGTVDSPYGPNATAQISKDGTVAFANVTFDELSDKLPVADIQRVVDLAKTAATPSVQVELGGDPIERINPAGTGGLPIGLGLAAIVLFIAFGSLMATALPLVAAGFALVTGVAAMGLLSNAISMPDFSTQLALLLGLGVGVDYALFIVTRYRQGLMRGLSSGDATVQSLDTSGRAVLFAGMTVCIALLGMLALRVSVLGGVGIAASVVVAFTVLAALTLTPALLGFIGLRALPRRARRALSAGELSAGDESPAWRRWADLLRARPALMAGLATALMLLIAVPFLSIRVGSTDAGSDPSSTTTRKAYDLLAAGFGPGFNGPLQLVARVGQPGQRRQFDRVVTTVGRVAGVQSTTQPAVVGGGVAVAEVIPTRSPQDASTSTLVTSLRKQVLPAASQGKVRVLVSRIYESWHHTKENTEAVTPGLAATGRTITAAAAIMVLVFGAFILGGEHIIKVFGVGLASAVLLDALIVRSTLTPALILVIGERQWSLPKGLDRLLPHLDVEGDVRRPAMPPTSA